MTLPKTLIGRLALFMISLNCSFNPGLAAAGTALACADVEAPGAFAFWAEPTAGFGGSFFAECGGAAACVRANATKRETSRAPANQRQGRVFSWREGLKADSEHQSTPILISLGHERAELSTMEAVVFCGSVFLTPILAPFRTDPWAGPYTLESAHHSPLKGKIDNGSANLASTHVFKSAIYSAGREICDIVSLSRFD